MINPTESLTTVTNEWLQWIKMDEPPHLSPYPFYPSREEAEDILRKANLDYLPEFVSSSLCPLVLRWFLGFLLSFCSRAFGFSRVPTSARGRGRLGLSSHQVRRSVSSLRSRLARERYA